MRSKKLNNCTDWKLEYQDQLSETEKPISRKGAAKIFRDQMHYSVAHSYADRALSIAESIRDDELVATAYYTRGCIKLQ